MERQGRPRGLPAAAQRGTGRTRSSPRSTPAVACASRASSYARVRASRDPLPSRRCSRTTGSCPRAELVRQRPTQRHAEEHDALRHRRGLPGLRAAELLTVERLGVRVGNDGMTALDPAARRRLAWATSLEGPGRVRGSPDRAPRRLSRFAEQKGRDQEHHRVGSGGRQRTVLASPRDGARPPTPAARIRSTTPSRYRLKCCPSTSFSQPWVIILTPTIISTSASETFR